MQDEGSETAIRSVTSGGSRGRDLGVEPSLIAPADLRHRQVETGNEAAVARISQRRNGGRVCQFEGVSAGRKLLEPLVVGIQFVWTA